MYELPYRSVPEMLRSNAQRYAERIAVNVDSLFREYRGAAAAADPVQLFGLMSRVRRALR